MTHRESTKARRARAIEMAVLVLSGHSRESVGEIYNVSRQRVQQMLKVAIPVIRAAR